MYKRQARLTFASGSLVGVRCKLVQFVVYCVLFVTMSTTLKKNQLFRGGTCLDSLCFFSDRKLGQYADQELLKSLFHNKSPSA